MGILQTIANKLFPSPVNKYEGAGQSLRRSYLDTSYTSARFDVTSSTRQAIVRKSRFFEQNNAIMNRLGDLFESYTVGSNFSVQPASSDPDWNLKAKKYWDIWSRYPDISSRQSFGTLMSQAARGWFFDGESFILLTKGDSGRPRLQLLEAQSIATPTGMQSDETVFDGIRFDPRTGRAIAYFIGNEKTQGNLTDVRSIGSDSVVHIYEPMSARLALTRLFTFTSQTALVSLEVFRLLAALSTIFTISMTCKSWRWKLASLVLPSLRSLRLSPVRSKLAISALVLLEPLRTPLRTTTSKYLALLLKC